MTLPTVITDRGIDELAHIVRDEIEQAQISWRNALRHARAAGDALNAVQPKVAARGLNWKKWLRENCLVSDRTAQLYQQLARHRDDIESELQRGVELFSTCCTEADFRAVQDSGRRRRGRRYFRVRLRIRRAGRDP